MSLFEMIVVHPDVEGVLLQRHVESGLVAELSGSWDPDTAAASAIPAGICRKACPSVRIAARD